MEAVNDFQFQFRLQYCYDVENLLYPSKVSQEHVVQFKGPSRAFCLRCCSDVGVTKIGQHLRSEKHARSNNAPAYDCYHRIFMEFDNAEQIEQIYFQPFDTDQIYCEMCETTVLCGQVATHIGSKNHKSEKKLQENRYFSGGKIVINVNSDDGINIPDDIAMLFYPTELTREVNKISAFKFPVIQRTIEYTQCLICKIVIPGPLWSSEILNHVRSKTHESSKSNKLYCNDVKSYHNFWAVQPPNVQLYQYKYRPHRDNAMFCLFCRQVVNFDSIAVHSLEKCKYGEEQRITLDNIEAVVPDEDERILEYDPATINALYSNYNTMKGQRRPDVYFMQKRTDQDRFCLYCLKSVYASPTDHLVGKKHLGLMSEPSRKDALNEYHRFWMSQEPDVQLIQVHFAPFNKETVKCWMCSRNVSFKEVLSHKCLKVVKKSIEMECRMPEDLRRFDLKYHDVTRSKFYSRSFMETTKLAARTNMPLGLHYLGRINCLICHQRIIRDMGLWSVHLMKHRCDNDFVERLQVILQYHKYFVDQPVNVQLYQVQFFPRTTTTVVCHKKHEMRFDNISEHSKYCQIRFLVKVQKSFEKALMQVSRKQNSSESESENDDDTTNANNENEENVEPSDVHTIVPSIENPGSNNPLDSIPLRFSKQKDIFNIMNSDSVHCVPCNELVPNKYIMKHLAKQRHLKMKDFWGFRYECDICQTTLRKENKWVEHFFSMKHISSYKELSDARKLEVMEYECLTCKTIIYGDKKTLLQHLDQKRSKKKERKIVLRPDVRKMFESPSETDKIASLLVEKCEEARRNDSQVKLCLEALEKAIGTKYPGCKAYPFGSRVTGIGKLNSDLDAFMDIGDMYLGMHNQDASKQQDIVLKVRKILVEDKANFSDVVSIASARTPIVRVIHKGTDIDVDLSFRHGLSVENTKYISFCLELQPIAKEAMLLLKEWAEKMELKEHLTSYALCMMFIFYMQRRGYLLSVEKLRELTGKNFKVIDGWETINYTKSVEELRNYVPVYTGNVYEILKNFFHTYTEFPFATDVVCPLLGRTFPVSFFEKKGLPLPKAMLPYALKVRADVDCHFKTAAAMFVQDPFDLGHNLTKATQKSFMTKFKTVCALAVDYMDARSSGSS